jgi:hypothetical protein
MTMDCSYLRGSYYHDPYFRKLYRDYFHDAGLSPAGRSFLQKIQGNHAEAWGKLTATRRKANDDPARRPTPNWWTYPNDPSRADRHLRPLRSATLFVKVSNPELAHLASVWAGDRGDHGDHGDRGDRKNHAWPLQEMFVAEQHKRVAEADEVVPAIEVGNDVVPDDEENDGDSEVHADDARLLERQRFGDVAVGEPRRSARSKGRAAGAPSKLLMHRYLLSPKVTRFIARIYADIITEPTAVKDARGNVLRYNYGRKGIHYVYTSNNTTALLLAEALKRVLQMRQIREAKEVRGMARHDLPGFVMIDEVPSQVDMLGAHLTREAHVADLKRLVSSDENAYGQIVKVVIAAKKSFKGVDLRHVRYLHLLDPMVNFRDFIQFVGRGPRNCGHAGHPLRQRFVEVIVYRLLYSPEHECGRADVVLPDCFLWAESYRRYTQKEGYKHVEDEVLWKSSVDYLVFKDNLSRARTALADMVRDLKCSAKVSGKNQLDGFRQLAAQVKNMRFKQYKATLNQQYRAYREYPPLAHGALRAHERVARELDAAVERWKNADRRRRGMGFRDRRRVDVLAEMADHAKSIESARAKLRGELLPAALYSVYRNVAKSKWTRPRRAKDANKARRLADSDVHLLSSRFLEFQRGKKAHQNAAASFRTRQRGEQPDVIVHDIR